MVYTQNDILNKIRAEIMDTGAYEQEVNGKTEFLEGINYCLSIIDNYWRSMHSFRKSKNRISECI